MSVKPGYPSLFAGDPQDHCKERKKTKKSVIWVLLLPVTLISIATIISKTYKEFKNNLKWRTSSVERARQARFICTRA